MRGYSIADYHVHPDFSFDAEGTLDEYCQMGLAQGLTEICFTTHYDTNPVLTAEERSIRIEGKLQSHSIERFGAYVEAVRNIHEHYYAYGLSVKCGVEIGYHPGCEAEIKELVNRYPLDYKIGSIHEVGEFKICYERSMKECAAAMPFEIFINKYFELMNKMVATRLFDAVGHLDRFRTHAAKYFGKSFTEYQNHHIPILLETMKDNDVGYEINTLAVNYGESHYYPSMDIINLARKAGVRIVAIGSDAHNPKDLSRDFETATAVAYELFPYQGE